MVELGKVEQDCLDGGIHMAGCSETYYGAMDSILNVVYQRLKKQMDAAEFKELKASEVEWLKVTSKKFKKFDKEANEHELGPNMGMATAYDNKAKLVEERIRYLLTKLK